MGVDNHLKKTPTLCKKIAKSFVKACWFARWERSESPRSKSQARPKFSTRVLWPENVPPAEQHFPLQGKSFSDLILACPKQRPAPPASPHEVAAIAFFEESLHPDQAPEHSGYSSASVLCKGNANPPQFRAFCIRARQTLITPLAVPGRQKKCVPAYMSGSLHQQMKDMYSELVLLDERSVSYQS
jgi:hypothetical protein